MGKRRNEYYKYLDSGHWRQLRNQAFERDGYKCIKCNSGDNLNGHHKRYRNLYDCVLSDIETLCEKCHKEHHEEKRAERRRRRKEKKRLGLIIGERLDPLVYLICRFDAKP